MELWTTYNQTTGLHEVRGSDPDTGDQRVYFEHEDWDTAWAWLVDHR